MTEGSDEALARQRLRESRDAMTALLDGEAPALVARAADVIATALAAGGKLLVFGNGGSAADAAHVAAELVGRFQLERSALPAIALTENSAAVTAISNDYGYEQVFRRQLDGLGRSGDVALGISTSGNSANVALALEAGRGAGLRTIAFTGAGGGPVADASEICIRVPSDSTARIQEAHGVLAHVLCELVERACAA